MLGKTIPTCCFLFQILFFLLVNLKYKLSIKPGNNANDTNRKYLLLKNDFLANKQLLT